eukprot:GILJ01030030.1.p1 GENE.GILJ01030030.1~~GILJ01030030.1.p1  ORF type:complete len:147 (-),score=20.83 GILJ01030030.1:34-426(-)
MTPEQQQHERKLRRIRSLQFQPVTSLPMTLFMLWMVGNDLSIFSIMFVGMSIMTPITSLMNTPKTFQMFEGEADVRKDVALAKLIYGVCCLAALGVGLMKVSWMGLLPVNAIDWLDHSPPRYAEVSFASF